MKCALAAVGFINENILYNKKVIMDTMIKYAGEADIIIFGEAFLQGFYGAKFIPEQDETIAIAMNDTIIQEICSVAGQYSIAVSLLILPSRCRRLRLSLRVTIPAFVPACITVRSWNTFSERIRLAAASVLRRISKV